MVQAFIFLEDCSHLQKKIGDQPCLALFDRGGLQAKLRVRALGVLTSLDAAVDWLDERKAALV